EPAHAGITTRKVPPRKAAMSDAAGGGAIACTVAQTERSSAAIPSTDPFTVDADRTVEFTGSTRASRPATPSATHNAERVTVIPDGCRLNGISTAEFVSGSILTSRLDGSLTTHTTPSPVAIALGRTRSAIVALVV